MAVVRTWKFFARSFRLSELGGVHGAQPEHDSWNLVALQAEKTKVFAGHTRWIVEYMFRAQRSNQRRLDSRRQRAVVDCDRGASVENRDNRTPLFWDTRGDRYTSRRVRIPSSAVSRAFSLKARTESSNFTSSGIMLRLVPAWISPTVTTAASRGST